LLVERARSRERSSIGAAMARAESRIKHAPKPLELLDVGGHADNTRTIWSRSVNEPVKGIGVF
jgi:hypothetical protein